MPEDPDPDVNSRHIEVRSIFGYRTQLPLVHLIIDDNEPITLSVEIAQKIGRDLEEAAQAALVDAFMINWLSSTLKTPPNFAAGLLQEFRLWRAARQAERDVGAEGQSAPS